ncbi:MAG: hypothetical protein N2109_12945 [Fimbriimonadales bacterium]|nr:hypothetical protein [Fimbriimonadales bacterium]
MTTFVLEIDERELDLPLCVSSGQVFRWRRHEGGSWAGADGDTGFVCEPVRNGWRVTTNGLPEDFRRLFQLDRSLADTEARIVELAPELEPYVHRLPGLRLLRPQNLLEVLFSFLCTTNNHLERITRMVRRLEDFGEPIGGLPVRAFPSLERLACVTEGELREAGFGYRARTLVAVARRLVELGPQWRAELRRMPYREAHAALQALPGVGPKVADCVCLIGLHHGEAAPIDTHLWQAACRLFFPQWRGKSLTQARYQAVGDALRSRFGELTGWAHQYLFYDSLLRWRARHRGNEGDTLGP